MEREESYDVEVRWAIVADEAMILRTLAEELLSAQELEHLHAHVNEEQPERWTVYRAGDRRIQALTGKELWETLHFLSHLGNSSTCNTKRSEAVV